MRTSVSINRKLKLIAEMQNESKFQVLEYDELKGSTNLKTTIVTKYLRDASVSLKQVKITLMDSAIKIQNNSLSYMKGDIVVNDKEIPTSTLVQKFFGSKASEQVLLKSILEGSGEVFLEPTLENFVLIELYDEEIIINDDIFYACEDSIEVMECLEKSIGTIELDLDKTYKLNLKGEGVVILKIPVPESEIIRCKIYQEKLTVNKNLAVLRTGTVSLNVETLETKDDRAESFIDVYTGAGEVWLLPTKNIYDNISNTVFEKNIFQEYVEE